MKNRNYGLYAVAAAILVVGILWIGVPWATLGVFALVLACPLMMLFMMRGMQGTHGNDHQSDSPEARDDRSPHPR